MVISEILPTRVKMLPLSFVFGLAVNQWPSAEYSQAAEDFCRSPGNQSTNQRYKLLMWLK